ncbi:hypothetical protein ACFZDJ_08645 [Streptomyces sp. NPDC007896]|uniref:hypothetical protein n=1 Tax=Streptomyces sp. NPDC007896 TaxID=3364784 RepID=UPI0036EAD44D
MRAITERRALVGVAALLAATSGCSQAEICAGVGTVSSVGVLFVHQGYGDLGGASFELCARGRCTKGELPQEGVTRVSLPLPHDVDPDSGPIRFRVTRKDAPRPVIDTSADVRLTFQSDNCGGGDYGRGLAFTKEGGLTAKIPKAVSEAWFKQIRSRATSEPDPAPSS